MKGKLRVVIILAVLGVLLVPSVALAQDNTGGGTCVIIQGPSRTELGIIGPDVTVEEVHSFYFTGPQITFGGELSTTPHVTLPAVQFPPSPCVAN